MTFKVIFVQAAVFFILPLPTVLLGAEWYVDASVSSSGDGTTPETAFQTIGEGMAAASVGDEVIVAEGIYVENVNVDGKSVVLRSMDPNDWGVVEKTVIDGNKAGSVVTFAGMEDDTCVLSGFTIRNGKAGNGGGILGGTADLHTHAAIQNCIITGNSASGNGSGSAFCDGVIGNCIIVDNLASGTANGGGLHDCDGIIRNNLVLGNHGWNGGGFYVCDGLIQNNTLSGNSAGRGSGMSTCNGTVTNCILWGNTAQYRGAEYDFYTMGVSYCCVAGYAPGEGNIGDDPLFCFGSA